MDTKKVLALSLSVSLLVIALAVSYYFVFHKPTLEREEFNYRLELNTANRENQEKCISGIGAATADVFTKMADFCIKRFPIK